jgi:hypothetical protein
MEKLIIVLVVGLMIGLLGASVDDTQLVTPKWESR